MKIEPFTLPLSPEEFRLALHKGQGRALMDVTRFGGREELLPVLIDAAVRDPSYDPQCEDERGAWIVDIASEAGWLSALEQEVARELRIEGSVAPGEFWDAAHRRSVAANLIDLGCESLRPLLRSTLKRIPGSRDVVGAKEVIMLDGEEGLVFVARALGTIALGDPDFLLDEAVVDVYDALHGEGEGWRVLESAARSDSTIEHFVERAKDPESNASASYRSLNPMNWLERLAEKPRPERRSYSGDAVVAAMREGRWKEAGLSPVAWGRRAAPEDLEVVLSALAEELDEGRLIELLKVFSAATPPRFEARLLTLCVHASSDVRFWSFRALCGLKDPRVRGLALRLVRTESVLDGAIRLFVGNYESGDHRLIEEALQVPEDRDHLHRLVGDVEDVSDANDPIECRALLEFIYEHSPCSLCREAAAKRLDENGILAPWIREECEHDVSEALRELAENR